MRKIYVLLLMFACAMGVRAEKAGFIPSDRPDLCEVTGVGDFEDVEYCQLDYSQYENNRMLSIAFFTSYYWYYDFSTNGSLRTNDYDGTMYVITINRAPNGYKGTYSLDDGSGVYSIINGETQKSACTSGEAVFALNDDHTGYDIVITMNLKNGETLRGVITGFCASEALIEADLNDNQGIESIQPSAVSSQKVIRDGQLFIIRGDKTFNALGAEMK